MTDYQALRIDANPCSEDITDLLAAFLADVGYESFSPDEKGLTAYIRADLYNTTDVSQIIAEFPIPTDLSANSELVIGKDWNSEWEQHYFKPIVIAGKCVVHSSFHTDVPEAPIDIVIDPKMAFGTGHHSTTNLMMSYLLDMNPENKSLIDMGAGTGILSILAHKLGFKKVTGIEIDSVAWENGVENCRLNDASEITMLLGDASVLPEVEQSDALLANINRNIILNDIMHYADALKDGGDMFLSGFYSEDIPLITEAAAPYGLELEETRIDNNWAAIHLKKH